MGLSINPKGFGLSLSLYDISVNSISDIELKLIDDANMFLPGDSDEGFCHAQSEDDVLIAEFKTVSFFTVDVADAAGENVSKDFKRIEECGMILFKDMLCLYGKNTVQKQALYKLAGMLDITIEPRKFTKEEMREAEGNALEIKSIQLDNIPHSEISKIRMVGKMEDIYGIKGLDLSNSVIKNFTGRFDSPDGNVSIKLGDSGKLGIYKIKGKPINISNIRYFIELFCEKDGE